MDELPVELQLQLNCNSVDHRTSDSNTDYSSKKSSKNLDNDKKKKRVGEEINEAVMDDVFANGKNRAFVPFIGSPNFSAGRVWKRSYLLYGPAGTGKSTFVAAMAKFVSYDIYEIDLHKVRNDADLKYLLLQTTKRSVLVVEDLDRHLEDKSAALSLSGVLNFMDGIFSSCGDERIMVFTMNSKENVGASILRPGRIDVHINFPLCDFTAFKYLASSHLGLKEHKLFPQVEEIFQTGATLSQAEIGEIMISNRGSPSRALKTVITALQGNLAARVGKRLSGSGSGRVQDEPDESVKEGQNGVHPMKDIKNLYGFLRARSSRKASMDKFDIDLNDRENSVHGHEN